MPLPFFAQHLIEQVVQMPPLVGPLILSPTSGNDMHMGIVLTTATVGLNHHDIAPFERLTTDPAKEITTFWDVDKRCCGRHRAPSARCGGR